MSCNRRQQTQAGASNKNDLRGGDARATSNRQGRQRMPVEAGCFEGGETWGRQNTTAGFGGVDRGIPDAGGLTKYRVLRCLHLPHLQVTGSSEQQPSANGRQAVARRTLPMGVGRGPASQPPQGGTGKQSVPRELVCKRQQCNLMWRDPPFTELEKLRRLEAMGLSEQVGGIQKK